MGLYNFDKTSQNFPLVKYIDKDQKSKLHCQIGLYESHTHSLPEER